MAITREQVSKRRDREKVVAGIRDRRFTGEETLETGFDLCNVALRAAGERKEEEINDH